MTKFYRAYPYFQETSSWDMLAICIFCGRAVNFFMGARYGMDVSFHVRCDV